MWGRLMFSLVALAALAVGRPSWASPSPASPAQASDDNPLPDPAEPVAEPPPSSDDGVMLDQPELAVVPDSEFGPVILIERIDVTGNTATQTELIRRALPIAAGEVLHSSDRRLREARFKVLALGFFTDVTLAMHKGSQHRHVIVEVHVIERGTLVLNRLWFGSTTLSPWWLGADVGERNLSGLGIAVGGGFIFTRHGEVAGARDQYAGELRLADPSVRGSRWGASWATTLVRGSEPYRVVSGSDDSAVSHRAFPYRRLATRLGASYSLSALTRLTMGLRAESIEATLPVAPTLTLSDGRTVGQNLHLEPGTSYVVTASLGYDRDTRPDPILPHAGSRVLVLAELGTGLLGGSYDFATLFGSYEHYWPVAGERHAIAVKLAGGVVVGDAPRFDRIHIADVDRMLTPRALGLVLSTAAPLAILGTRADKPSYGDLGGSATVEYIFQLFRGRGERRVYGGDLFAGVGLWGLAEQGDLRARDTGLTASLPLDVYVDAGLRIDTDIGTFELTIANALGRLR